MPKIAVILSGCGHMDGVEIREAVIALLALDRAGADVEIFAPDVNQYDVVNHLTGKPIDEVRNVMVEAARIARGKVSPLADAKAHDFDAVIMPGGYGAAKNLSDLAIKGKNAKVIEDLKSLLTGFLNENKPIGAICIAPAVLTAAISDKVNPSVTIGEDNDGLIEGLGGHHIAKNTSEIAIDNKNNIITCSAYMRDDTISAVADGIEKLVNEIVKRCKTEGKKHV